MTTKRRDDGPRLTVVAAPPEGDPILAGLLSSVERDLRRIRRAGEAELWASGLLGILDGTVDAFAEGDPGEAREAFIVQLVQMCESQATPSALAVLRALSAVLAGSLRAMADESAARLARSGVKDRPWAARLGAATVGDCWHYGDLDGRQESVAVTFADGRYGEVLSVLIDRDLGGGVKDAWLSDDPDGVWQHTQEMAGSEPFTFVERISWQRARALLRAALAEPECPEQPDQVEDVAMHRALLHARLAKLNGEVWSPSHVVPATAGRPAQGTAIRRRSVAKTRVMRLKASIKGSRPPIWRRLEVPESITLPRLHLVLQAVFGWEDYHLHAFEVGYDTYMPPGEPLEEMDARSETRARLDGLVAPGDRFVYRYDFGDDWEVVLQVEGVDIPEEGVRYPRCTGGRRPGPPEDSGGIRHFQETADADDAARLDLDEINTRLVRMVRPTSLSAGH